MTAHLETPAQAWQRRDATRGSVDFTMMYVAHDAFHRDLARLERVARSGRVNTAAFATWTMFTHQLHVHHTAEDTSLWPRLRAAIAEADELAVLEAMQAEHETLDPLIALADDALRSGDVQAFSVRLKQLGAGLSAHTRHEEDQALPLIERRLGQRGWDEFGKDIRRAQGGIRAGATYLPWVLDGAPEPVRDAVLRLLPRPARMLYRRRWEPRYRDTDRHLP